jgi:hypothetical protein
LNVGVGGKQSGPRRGRRPWHVRKLSVFREPGDLASGRAASPPMSGRRGAVAGDEQTREVTLRHSSCEADEQSRATTGGAKGGDRGKRGKGRYAQRRFIRPILRTESGKGKPPGNRVKAIPFSSLRHRASKTSVFRRAMAPDEARFTVGIAAFPSPQPTPVKRERGI